MTKSFAIERPVPLLYVSDGNREHYRRYLHEGQEEYDSDAPLRLLAELHMPQIYDRRSSIDLQRISLCMRKKHSDYLPDL